MVVTKRLSLQTEGRGDAKDITDPVSQAVAESGLSRGVVVAFVTGSTAALTAMEYETGLLADLRALFQRLAPDDAPYEHDGRWGDSNGYAHVRASLVGPSLSVPFVEGKLVLGTWQQIVLLDFDIRRRQREVVLQVMGE